ncbi:hypothetical protein [Cellvibrio sp. KY-GH-1]|nr:hypothetical protein [Cellvibrio sp. KY-GH-1]
MELSNFSEKPIAQNASTDKAVSPTGFFDNGCGKGVDKTNEHII